MTVTVMPLRLFLQASEEVQLCHGNLREKYFEICRENELKLFSVYQYFEQFSHLHYLFWLFPWEISAYAFVCAS